MIGPLSLFAAVFAVSLVLQMVVSRRQRAVAIVTTVLPPAMLLLTLWWRIWDRDALWVIGVVVALLDCAAASTAASLVAWSVKRFRSGQPNDG